MDKSKAICFYLFIDFLGVNVLYVYNNNTFGASYRGSLPEFLAGRSGLVGVNTRM